MTALPYACLSVYLSVCLSVCASVCLSCVVCSISLVGWVQSERSLRREGSSRVHTLEAALQEAHGELKAEKLLLQEVPFPTPLLLLPLSVQSLLLSSLLAQH